MQKYIDFLAKFPAIPGFVRAVVDDCSRPHAELEKVVYHKDNTTLLHVAAYSIGGDTLSLDMTLESRSKCGNYMLLSKGIPYGKVYVAVVVGDAKH